MSSRAIVYDRIGGADKCRVVCWLEEGRNDVSWYLVVSTRMRGSNQYRLNRRIFVVRSIINKEGGDCGNL